MISLPFEPNRSVEDGTVLIIDHIFECREEDVVVEVVEGVPIGVEAEDELVVVLEYFLKGEAGLGSIDVEDTSY